MAEFRMLTDPRKRYVHEARQARDAELRVVKARSRLVRGVREFVRVSSRLPFPLQTWLLSEPDRAPHVNRFNLTFWLNLTLALVAFTAVTASLALAIWANPALWALWLLAVPFQLAGGATYGSALVFEGDSDHSSGVVWRVQIAALAVVGIVLAVAADHLALSALAALSWLLVGIPFVLGLYAFEAIERRVWRDAGL